MKTLPLTVLVREGPTARAYLARLGRDGVHPATILLMVYANRPDTQEPVAKRLPKSLRLWFAERLQEVSLNYWPRQIRKSHRSLFDSIVQSLKEITDDPGALLKEILGRFRYEDYSEDVRKILVSGLRDDALADALRDTPHPVILFSGGGIIPPSLLALPDRRFLHIHPGHLPHVRGADGVLWSTLVRGHPSASCFFMAQDIDTGPVIDVRDFPAIAVHVPEGERPDDRTLYRALFSYYDPLLRAETLSKVLSDHADLSTTWEQDASEGITYHFMHPSLRREALKRIFVSD